MLNYLRLSCLNHELNHKERADRHYTDNQDYNDFYNTRLGGARSLVRIQSSRHKKGSTSICRAFFVYFQHLFQYLLIQSCVRKKENYKIGNMVYKANVTEILRRYAPLNDIGKQKSPRIKNRCHTCQIPINNLIFSRFLWQVEPFFIVMACHALWWQRMTSSFASTCHRKSLSIKKFRIHWQVWQGFLNLTSPNICHPCNKPLNHQQIRR